MDIEEFQERTGEYEGLCKACGSVRYGVEPDARRYLCETCGERKVFGLEELVLMGDLEITAYEDEDHYEGEGE